MNSFAFADRSFAVNLKNKQMNRYVVIFGSVLGTILCANLFYMVNLCYTNPDFKSNDILGYAALVIVFSLTFFGIRNYRNKQLKGIISLGKAFKTGALIALLGSTVYVIVWLFYYYLFVPDFLDVYIPHALKEVPASDLAVKTKEMESLKEMYKNPLFVILITYSEVLPVGLVVAFISALVLKRKPNADTSRTN